MLSYLNRIGGIYLKQFSSNISNKIKHNFYKNVILISRKSFCSTTNIYNIDYDKLTSGNEDLLKKLKIITLEVDILRQEGGRVPVKMNNERWSELLFAKSKSQRTKQLSFWWINEKKKENDKERKTVKRLQREESKKEFKKDDDGHIYYGFGGNTIFIRIYDSTIDKWRNWKTIQAMLFNQPLIIDCGYENYMSNAEISNCAKQLLILFSKNRAHKEPFNLYFCNAKKESRLITKLNLLIPPLFQPDFPINIAEKNYLDLFPKEKLVYLTPHCREDLKNYNDDDIYIIGAMVDKENCEPLSLAKAKAEGLRMAKFPLDRYLDWNIGTKSLTINQSLSIMLDLKVTKSWDQALVHVPQRKLRNEENEINIDKNNTHWRKATKFTLPKQRNEKTFKYKNF